MGAGISLSFHRTVSLNGGWPLGWRRRLQNVAHPPRDDAHWRGGCVAPGEPKALDLSGRGPIIADGQHAAVTNGSSDHLPWEIPQFPPYASFPLQERIHTQGD
jgi:hypothetical protein